MWFYHDDVGWGWMLFGSLWMVAFWGTVIGLVVWGIRQATSSRTERPPINETPLEIAQKRLARGEITPDQFEELKRALQ